MSAARCIKLALLLSLVPLALRAASLIHLAGHAAVPAAATGSSSSRHHRHSWTARHDGDGSSSMATAAAAASAGPARDRDRDRRRPYRHATTTHRRRIAATRLLLRQVDWFEDDKRLAPTGSNPLHNLRR